MKNFKIKIFYVVLLCSCSTIFSQYTDVINSNKPGFSESPYSVGTGVYQFESNFFFRNTRTEPTFSSPQSLGANIFFRTSFFLEKLELNANVTFQRDKIAFKNIFTSHYFDSGLSNFTIGAKYLLFQQEFEDKSKEVRSWRKRNAFDKKRFIPSVAIYLGLNTDLVTDIHKTGKMTPKVGVLLQNDLSNRFNIITNLYYDKIGGDYPEFSYIITATQNFSDRWSLFFENQTVFKEYQNNTNIGTGLAYLFTKDLQINTSARMLLEGKSEGFHVGLGVSYRIDKHEDSYINLNESKKETPISKYNNSGGFFSKLFSVFKKDRSTSKRKKPSRSRKKKASKKNKKGLFGLFGKKKKKEETEIEKLEREIKELEKDIKKNGN